MKTYFIKTFGCQMNFSDSERIAAFLESQPLSSSPLAKGRGFLAAEKVEGADLVVFNTCGIKQTAENRAYSMIHVLKKNNKNVKIIMTGCLANRKDVQRRLKNLVDLFFPINDFKRLENFLRHSEQSEESHANITSSNSAGFFANAQNNCGYLSILPKHSNKHTAYVPIMTGCNNFCSYCVVPYARGREVSRPAEEIVSEIRQLIKNGCKHVILLGQNVNSYRGTWSVERETKFSNFSQLLKKINTIPGKFWISFVSSHPKDFDDELIETIAKCKKVCEWVHLPVQAGSDEIIRKMNRHYTQKQYLEKIAKIRKAFKKYKPSMSYSLSSDIIVGFPGETKKQFLQSAQVMKKVKFDMVFFGQFSPRPETAAWKMKDNVSRKEKARRENYLNEILAKTTFANNKKYVGKILEVLIEKQAGDFYFGKTRTMKNVKVISSKNGLVGKIIKAKIIKANVWNLEGKLFCHPERTE